MKNELTRTQVILVRNLALLLAVAWPLAAHADNYVLVDSGFTTYPNGDSIGSPENIGVFFFQTNTLSTDTNLVDDNWLVVATDASTGQGYDSAYSYVDLNNVEQSGTASYNVTSYCGGIATATWYSATGDGDEGILGFADITSADVDDATYIDGNLAYAEDHGPAWLSGDMDAAALLQTDYEETNLCFVNVTNNSLYADPSWTTNNASIDLVDNFNDIEGNGDFFVGPIGNYFTYSISYTNYYGFPDGGVDYLYGTVAMSAYATAGIGYSDAVDVGSPLWNRTYSRCEITMTGIAGIQLTKDRDGD